MCKYLLCLTSEWMPVMAIYASCGLNIGLIISQRSLNLETSDKWLLGQRDAQNRAFNCANDWMTCAVETRTKQTGLTGEDLGVVSELC